MNIFVYFFRNFLNDKMKGVTKRQFQNAETNLLTSINPNFDWEPGTIKMIVANGNRFVLFLENVIPASHVSLHRGAY